MVMGFAGEEEAFDEEEALLSQGYSIYEPPPSQYEGGYDPYDEIADSPAYDQSEPYFEPSYQEPSYPSYQAPDYSYSEPSYGGGWGSSVADEVDNSAFDEAWAQYNAPRNDYQDFGSYDFGDDEDEEDLDNFLNFANTGFDLIGKTRDALQDIDQQAWERDEARAEDERLSYAPAEQEPFDVADYLRRLSGLEGAQEGFAHGFDVPYVSDFSREYVQPAMGDFGDFFLGDVAPRLPGVGPVLNQIPEDWRRTIGREGAEALTPVTGEEFLLEGIPGVGAVPWSRIPDAFQAARRVGDDALGAVQRGLDLPQTYYRGVEPSFLESTRSGGLPEGLALTPDRGVAEAYAQRYGGEVMDFRARPSQMEPDSYYFRNKEPLMPAGAASAPRTIFHGTRSDSLDSFVDAQGNLHLNPSENFGGRQQGVSFTDDIKTAKDYASRVPGTPIRSSSQGYIIEVDASAVPNLRREADDELFYRGSQELIIPAGRWKATPNASTELSDWARATDAEIKAMPDDELVEAFRHDVMRGEMREHTGDLSAYEHVAPGISQDIVARYGPDPISPFIENELYSRGYRSIDVDPFGPIPLRAQEVIPQAPRTQGGFAAPQRQPSGFREAILQGETGAIRIPGRGTPPTLAEDATPVDKLTFLVRGAEKLPGETEELRSAVRSQRVAQAYRAMEGGTTAGEKLKRGAPVLFQEGELPRARFEAPEAKFVPDEIESLKQQLLDTKLPLYDTYNADRALMKVMAGQLNEITESELRLLEKVYGPELVKAILSKRPLSAKALDLALDVAGTPRTIMASMDISAPLRQGLLFGPSHPKEWAAAWAPMLKAYADEAVAVEVDDMIRGSKWAEVRDRAGLYLAPMDQALSSREEAMLSKWITGKINIVGQDIPNPIRASQRAYATFLNKLRSDVFDTYAAKWSEQGALTPQRAKSLAEYVNAATGRGNLGPLNKASPWLSAAFFAPRWAVSRFQTPLQLLAPGTDNAVRMLIARDLSSFMAAGSTVVGLAALAGAEVELDPRASDFAKIKIGNQRIDPWGGYQQIVRYIAQAVTGERKSASGFIYKADASDTLLRFFRTKMMTGPGLGVSALGGENLAGEPVSLDWTTIKREAWNSFVPLFIQDVRDGLKEEGIRGGLLGLLSVTGIGTQAYPPPTSQRVASRYDQYAEEIAQLFPPELTPALQGVPYHELTPREREIADAYLKGKDPELLGELERARTESDSPFARARQAVEAAWQERTPQMDALFQSLFSGGDAKQIRETVSDIKTEIRTIKDLNYNSPEYQAAVASMPESEAQKLIDQYYSIIDRVEQQKGYVDWDLVEKVQTAFLAELANTDRSLANRIAFNVQSQPDPQAHDLLKFMDAARPEIDAYYAVSPQQRDAWRIQNPRGDYLLWLLGYVTTVKTPQAAELAQKTTKGREIRLVR